MKAGLVIVVYVLKALHEYGYGKRPIRVVFAGDEENGHRQTNAESEIRKLCAGCAAAFNFETGFIDDGLVVGRKGSCRVTLTVHGVAAHAGNDPSAEETRFWRWRIRSSRSRNFMTLNMDFL